MSFPFNVYLLTLVASALASGLSLPLWRAWCIRAGHVDDPGHRKIHSRPIPLAGGLAVFTGLTLPLIGLVVTVQFQLFSFQFPAALLHGWERRGLELAAILFGALGMVLLGWWDDRHELRPAWKFSGQCAILLLVAAAGVRITLFVPNIFFSYVVTVLWILTVTNALNFMDNMNGLCSGLGVIGTWIFAVIAAVAGQYLVALLALLVCGALLGFLPYNFPRASAFLGDAGSQLVGYLLAVLSILPHFFTGTDDNRLVVLTPLLVLAVPLADLVCVVLLRLRLGKPFYIGDTNHFSHRLVRSGWSKTKAVMFIWLLAALTGALALL